MNRQQIIKEKDRILSNLLEGILDTVPGNSVIQTYRQKALSLMMYGNNLHHNDLGNEMTKLATEAWSKLSTKEIEKRLTDFFTDAAQLNIDSIDLEGERVFELQGEGINRLLSKASRDGADKFKKYVKFTINSLKETNIKDPQTGNVFVKNKDNYRYAAGQILDSLTNNVNRREISMGIRHVFPESLEQRVLMNHGLDIIEFLQNAEGELYNPDELDVEIDWNRIAVPQENFKGNRLYTPPENLSQLRELHTWWTNEFNKKAKEFVLGDNVFLLMDDLTENIINNDAYYQYAGMGQRNTPAPPIVQLIDEKLSEFLQELTRKYGVEVFDEMRSNAGLAPNDLDVYEKLGDGSREAVKQLTKEKIIEFIEANSSASDDLLPVIYPEVQIGGMTNMYPSTTIYESLNGPVLETQLFKNRIDVTNTLQGNVNELDTTIGVADTPTNVVPNVETLNIDDYKPFTLEVTDPAGLHARPAAGLLNDLQSQGLKLILMEDGVLKEVGLTGILKRGIPVNGTLELFVPKDLISIDMGDGSRGYRAQTTRGTLRVMDDASVSVHSDRIRQIAQDYHQIMGYSDPQFKPAMVFNDEVGAISADIFERLPMFDDTAIPYYKKFIGETNMQYQVLLDSGMNFEIVDVDPYTPNKAGHQQMIADMESGTLKVLATDTAFGYPLATPEGIVKGDVRNPMLAASRYTDINGRIMLENDVFRAVHDTFGHGMRGNTFGPIGEYNAWLAHKEMYSPDARRIMTTETLGQNTYTNYGQHMRDVDGNLIKAGDPNYIRPADRPFAPQKVALMPEEIIDVAGTVVEDAAELVDSDSLNKVKELANAQPEVVDGIFKSAKKVVGKVFGAAGTVLDPGDLAITTGISRILPRLGAAAIAPAALAAYVGYELSVLAIDAGQAFNKAIEKQGGQNDFVPSFMGGKTLEGEEPNYIDYDWRQLGKDSWQEFGEVSDTWSLSWKISEPIIDYAFEQYATMQESR
jgi:hypothetical protein